MSDSHSTKDELTQPSATPPQHAEAILKAQDTIETERATFARVRGTALAVARLRGG